MDYKKYKEDLIDSLETRRDVIITNRKIQKKRNLAYYNLEDLFYISDENDSLYKTILRAFDDTAFNSSLDIVSELCKDHQINFTSNAEMGRMEIELDGKLQLFQFEDSGFIRKIVFSRGRIYGLPDGSFNIVLLIKDTPQSRQGIEILTRGLKQGGITDCKCYLFEDFIKLIFNDDAWQQFYENMKSFKKEIHQTLGFQITEICTPQNLEKLKVTLEEEIPGYDYEEVYNRLYSIAQAKYDHPYYLRHNALENIKEIYLDRRNNGQNARYKLLMGNSDFADSFLTSEWLYTRYISNNKKYDSTEELDNTFIVSGYLKSVEQLLWDIIKMIGQGKTIQKAHGSEFIELTEDNYDEINTMLKSLENFLRDHEDEGIFIQNHFVVTYMRIQLSDWRGKNRNGYFHKDNLHDPDKVKTIRDDTHFLYMLILGSIKLDDSQLERLS